MRLYDLLEKVSWQDVREALTKAYPIGAKAMGGYKNEFLTLLSTLLAPSRNTLFLEEAPDGSVRVSVGRKSDGPDRRSGTGGRFYRPGLEVDEDAMKTFTPSEIVAHVIHDVVEHSAGEEEEVGAGECPMETILPGKRNRNGKERPFGDLLWNRIVRQDAQGGRISDEIK